MPDIIDTFSVVSLLADASSLATALALQASKGPIDHEVFHARIVKIRKLLLTADRANRLEWAYCQEAHTNPGSGETRE